MTLASASHPDRSSRPKRSLGWALVLATAALGASAAAPAPRPRVTVDTGALEGVREGGLVVFKGVPYAAPPVGPLRWRAPQPAAAWSGVRDAARFGFACPQDTAHKEPWAQVGARSEDCLTLNVWAPAGARHAAVMVFLHGGGFTYGAADVPLYDGAALARRGVVLMTLNYRLGRLGFFAHPALTAETPGGPLGNYGIMDQAAALRWVQRNIARFGGDPRNVTAFGESAGAGTVQSMMGSPFARGLFQKAVSESGAGGAALQPLAVAEQAGEAWTRSLGLTRPTAADLRAIPVEKTLGRAYPFIDGEVVVASPGRSFHDGTEAAVPLIIGANTGEFSLPSNTPAAARAVLGADYERLLEAYRHRPGVPAADAERDLAEDASSVQPSLFIADMHAAHGAPAYAYAFGQVPVAARPGIGTEHGGELEYLFGNKPADHAWDAGDRRVARLMGDYWVRFAKTGDPNGPGAPAWPRVAGRPTALLAVGDGGAHAVRSTGPEEEVRALALAAAEKRWAAEAAR